MTEPKIGVYRATYYGQATVIIELDRIRLITDPIFVSRLIGIIPRRFRPMATPEQLPEINMILISHGHFDHLSTPCLRRFNSSIPIIAPAGYERVFSRWRKSNVYFLSDNESIDLNGIRISSLPVRHIAGRWPFQRNGKCLAYLIEGQKTVFFAGDTAYFKINSSYFAQPAAIDLAILPIGAYYPAPWRRYHMSPEDAIMMFNDLRADRGCAIHWGTYRTSLESAREPKLRLNRLLHNSPLSERFLAPDPGETIEF